MDVRVLDIERIHRAFSPAREIHDPQLFVGRKNEMLAGINALLSPGSFLAIFGLRGVGKSSIGYQIKLIAEGNTTLPHRLDLSRSLPRRSFKFHVHYIKSDGFVKNIPDLLKRVLFGDDDNPSLFSLTKTGDRKMVEFKKALEASGGGKILGVGASGKGVWETRYEPQETDDLIQQFRQLLRIVRKDIQNFNTGLLILIDEFDTIPDKRGFASIVKACSSEFVKFGVIGIGTNVSELIKDHNSIGRQLELINVPTMPSYELFSILKRAEFVVDNAITFDENAAYSIISKSEGFPYFTHLLGKEAMLLAFNRKSSRVMDEDIEQLAEMISSGRLNTIYEDLYHSSVKSSEHREILLKIFAEQDDDEMLTEPVYRLAKEFGISNPSQLMKELTSSDGSPPVLTKVRDRFYRFSDPVFKIYARMRQWKF